MAQPSVTFRIIVRFVSVLPSIKFYNEPLLQTHKIDDVVTERLLAPKLVIVNLPQAEPLPE